MSAQHRRHTPTSAGYGARPRDRLRCAQQRLRRGGVPEGPEAHERAADPRTPRAGGGRVRTLTILPYHHAKCKY
eukprot:6223202-Pyramimonas_sp.AAC.4